MLYQFKGGCICHLISTILKDLGIYRIPFILAEKQLLMGMGVVNEGELFLFCTSVKDKYYY